MLTTHTQVVQISIAYSTRIELLFDYKIMYETSLIMERGFHGIFGTVLLMSGRETAVIVVFVDRPEAYETIDRPFCKLWIATIFPGFFHKVKWFVECIGRVVRRCVYLVCHMLPRYYTMM